jgi:hypothetical protein
MRQASSTLVMLLSVCGTCFATDAAAPVADVEVLEFLGEFATDDGGWLDPQQLSDSGMLERAELDLPEKSDHEQSNDDSL